MGRDPENPSKIIDCSPHQDTKITPSAVDLLPNAKILMDFEHAVHKGAERVFSAWESETNHRHEMERLKCQYDAREAMLSKVLAFVFVLSALALCAYALREGSQVTATVLGGGVIASVVWAFVKLSRN